MINILELNLKTIKSFKECFDVNGSPKQLENIEWQFIENPEKKCFVDIAFDSENKKTAGIYAVSCVKFKIANSIYVGAQSLDTITDINYRGQGLFTKLANDVYLKAKDFGIALVYGFPNGSSIHGFEKKLEWQVLDPLPFLIKPIKSKYFTDKIRALKFLPNINLSFSKFKVNKKYTLNEVAIFPVEVNELWKQFSEKIKVAVVRDKAYLDWRYIQKPNEDYKIVHCYDKDEVYLGFVIYSVKEKHNGKIGYIMELIYNLDNPEVGKTLLKFAINKIKQNNADCILAWCFRHSPNYNIYKNMFFINMPEKLRPIELHFGVRSLKDNIKGITNNRENWFISYSDSDTV